MDWQFKVGIGLAILFGALPFAVKAIPNWLSWPGVAVGLGFVVWAMFPGHERYPIWAAAVFLLGLSLCVGVAGWLSENGLLAAKKTTSTPSLLTLFATEGNAGLAASTIGEIKANARGGAWSETI